MSWKKFKEDWFYPFILPCLFAIFALIMCSSCKSVQYVPVETILTEVKQVHDTVKIQDSVKHEKQLIIREADTSEIERLNTEFGFKLDKAQKTILILRKELERQSHNQQEVNSNTIIKEKEVQVPYPVEKKLSRWQQLKMDLGGVAIALIIIAFIILFIAILRKMASKG